MDVKRRQPIGIELVKRGIVSQEDVRTALDYQKVHPMEKLGDIIHKLRLCDDRLLLEEMGNILGEKTILITPADVKVKMDQYISLDVLKNNHAVLFDVDNGKALVCFADVSNARTVETIRLLLLNRGLVMERYISFSDNIEEILNNMGGTATTSIGGSSTNGGDATSLVDGIIKKGMERRASDIHFEPMENKMRIRYRIDGELFEVGEITKDKQTQVIRKIKSNFKYASRKTRISRPVE